MEKESRRSFIKKSAVTALGISALPYGLYGSVGANDTINIGVIGLGFGAVNI